MRILLAAFALATAALLLSSGAGAQDKKGGKAVVLKGLIACNKCELNKSTECETLIVVTDAKKKEVFYFFDKASHGKYHDGICGAAKKGTVTGVVKDVDKKKVITVQKLEYAK